MESNWEFGHIGITVRDIDKAIEYYQSIGATLIDGPAMPDFDIKGWRYHGKTPDNIKTKSCHLEIGGLTLELHQPVEGESPFTEFLEKNGEGVDHIDFYVDDVQKETEKMVAKGYEVILSMTEGENYDQWVGVILDTRQYGDLTIELSNKALVDANRASWQEID